MTMRLSSPAFTDGGAIPTRFTCDGDDVSPPLAWEGAPDGTQSFALVIEDPDAPGGTFIHWVLVDLPKHTASLPEGVPQTGKLPSLDATQGPNDYPGRVGYGGPCPPPGPAHRYFFRLYALDRRLGLLLGTTRADLAAAVKGHVLAEATLMGTYARRRNAGPG